MKMSFRTRVAFGLVCIVGLIATLWAQEAQQINRALAVTQGNVTISRGVAVSGAGAARDYRPVTTVTDGLAHTFTTAEILSGYILRTGLTANRTDVLPTAVDLIAAVPGIITGHSFTVFVDIGATPGAASTINGASTGVTYGASCSSAIDTNDVSTLLINITSATTYRVACADSKN